MDSEKIKQVKDTIEEFIRSGGTYEDLNIKPETNVVVHTQDSFPLASKVFIGCFLLFFVLIGIGAFYFIKNIYIKTENAITEINGFTEFYKVENWLYEKNPELRKRQREIRDMIHYTYIYSKLYNTDPFDTFSRNYWESEGFNVPNEFKIGKAGEIGDSQILPSTGALYGYTIDDLKNLEINIRFGAYYYSLLMKQYKNPNIALMVYNGGRGGIDNPKCQQYMKEVAALKNEIIVYVETL